MLDKLFKTKEGVIIVSIILGLGLASVFRQVCKGSNCIIIKGPSIDEVTRHTYKIDKDCYKYSPVVVECES